MLKNTMASNLTIFIVLGCAVMLQMKSLNAAPLRCKSYLLQPQVNPKNLAINADQNAVREGKLQLQAEHSTMEDYKCAELQKLRRKRDLAEMAKKKKEWMKKLDRWNKTAYSKRKLILPFFCLSIILMFLFCCCVGFICRYFQDCIPAYFEQICLKPFDMITGRDPTYRTVVRNMERLGMTPPSYKQYCDMKDVFEEQLF